MSSWSLADRMSQAPKRLSKKERERLAESLKGVTYGNPHQLAKV